MRKSAFFANTENIVAKQNILKVFTSFLLMSNYSELFTVECFSQNLNLSLLMVTMKCWREERTITYFYAI